MGLYQVNVFVMTKTVLGWLIVGVVVVGVGAGVAINKNKNVEQDIKAESEVVDQSSEVADQSTESKVVAGSFSGSFADLMNRGGNWVCAVDHSTVVSETDGKVYISGKDIRGEFSVEAPYIGNILVNMIADGSDVYSWTSVTPQGVKSPQSSIEGDGGTETSGQVIDANQELTYDCQPWSRDDSKFAIPEINFMEVGY